MKKILFCLFALVLASCDTEDIISQLVEGTVKADINGQTHTWNFGVNSLGAVITSETAGTETIYALGVAASTDGVSDNSETKSIGIVVFIDHPDDVVAGASFSTPSDIVLGTYAYDNEAGTSSIDADQTLSATLNIASVNDSEGTISGTFNYETTDEDTGITYTISNGSFTDIPYHYDF
ncbi:hypothetical protein HNV08_07095 [Winogradskyella eckloniae]|uniref:hypothetical protein n=1 Tax=Winogradskyella eckloniae TaxID=1089306 RepID=UPI001566E480|nr:hypothetical protein [Winogradskyella eckloniae]NRD19811.1 hypothetical protein [Winogradskyella eckloniae]